MVKITCHLSNPQKITTMKIVYLISLFFLLSVTTFAQGKFAGPMQSLVGTSYTDNRHIPGLEDWEFNEGSLLSNINDPEWIMVDVYKKGATRIVFFSVMEDTASHTYVIADVIYLKAIGKGWLVKTSLCSQGENEDPGIVAIMKVANAEYMTVARQAWKFNRDKRRVEAINVKGIRCMNEGFGE